MLELIILVLLGLWFFGYIDIGLKIPNIALLVFNGRQITLWDVLVFLVILWAVSLLPSPFREISGVLAVLWVLSMLGILAIAGLSNLLIIAVIIGIAAAILRRK